MSTAGSSVSERVGTSSSSPSRRLESAVASDSGSASITRMSPRRSWRRGFGAVTASSGRVVAQDKTQRGWLSRLTGGLIGRETRTLYVRGDADGQTGPHRAELKVGGRRFGSTKVDVEIGAELQAQSSR